MSRPGDFDHLSRTKVSSDKTLPFQLWVIDETITEEY